MSGKLLCFRNLLREMTDLLLEHDKHNSRIWLRVMHSQI